MQISLIQADELRKLLREELSALLPDVKSEPPTAQDGWISNGEFLRRYGVSKATAQRWRDERTLPFSKIGAKIFYRVSDVEEVFHSSRIERVRQRKGGR